MRFSGLPVALLAVALVYSGGIPAQTSTAGQSVSRQSRPKRIYVDAPPDAAPIKKQILAKLQAWGEISVVNLPEQADMILELEQSEKLNVFSGSGDRGSVILKNRRTGEELWTESRGGGWSMRGWSNAAVGRKLGDDLINFLSKNRVAIDTSELSKHD